MIHLIPSLMIDPGTYGCRMRAETDDGDSSYTSSISVTVPSSDTVPSFDGSQGDLDYVDAGLSKCLVAMI